MEIFATFNKFTFTRHLSSFRKWITALLYVTIIGATAPSALSKPITIEHIYAKEKLSNFSLSPSGKYLAMGDNTLEDSKTVLIVDLDTLATVNTLNVGKLPINWVRWATDERLIVSISMQKDIKLPSNLRVSDEDGRTSRYLKGVNFSRMIALDRDGKNSVLLFTDAGKRLKSNYRLDTITSILHDDPDHILVPADDNGINLYKVNINTGAFEKIEDGRRNTHSYDVTRKGVPIARYDTLSSGKYIRIMVRAEGEAKWIKLMKVRLEDLETVSIISETETPGIFYVSATPDGKDRAAIYRYDLNTKTFLDVVAEHPRVDLTSALVDEGGNFVGTVFNEHRVSYEFQDPSLAKHIAALDKNYRQTMNVIVNFVSANGKRWIIKTSGPKDAGTYHVYNLENQQLNEITPMNTVLDTANLSNMETINYTASDGLVLSGYLTRPDHATADTPLVVLVHGGPQARDYYDFDPLSQYLASHGYAVFQPQFRGSSGFGSSFAEAAFGEWGQRMQEDVSDGVEHLIQKGKARQGKICIAGISYGGYAALMGAIRTPDLYQCASSIAGASDLPATVEFFKKGFGKKSETFQYMMKQIGDPKRDMDRMIENSPRHQAEHIKIPIQLIHGTDDEIVPYDQSVKMQDALIAVNNPAEFIEMPGVCHHMIGGESKYYGRITMMKNLRTFLDTHLQPPT